MTREEREEAINIIKSECYVFNPLNFDRSTRINTALDMAIKALEQEQCNDAISRRAVLDTLDKMDSVLDKDRTVETYKELLTACYNDLPPVTSVYKQKWIPFTTRPLTEEEKEEHSEWDSILDCKLPDYGQRILVSISVRGHECVQYDEFYMDDGCYLDSGYEIGTEAVAWMPLPEPYKESEE